MNISELEIEVRISEALQDEGISDAVVSAAKAKNNMTNKTYPTPPGSRIAGLELLADGRPVLAKGHMMLSGKVMWDNAYAPIPFDPATMARVARPEPAWREASREQAESTRVVFPEPMPLSLLERAQYWAAIANGALDEWEKQKQDHP